MPRRLRIEFEGAIYHVMARGNARQKIVRDDADRRRLIDGLEQSVVRHGWELLCYVVMGNHLHLMVKTPRPNLGAGMQSFLSGYAIWAGRRWRRPGHLFQGRYRAEMIEDESYYWTVSRYIHLNPVRAGLVQRPEQWEWSSYPGYRDARRRKHGSHTTRCWPHGRAITEVETHDRRTSDSWSEAWTIRRHRRFAMPLAAGFWAPSDSWLDCEVSPVRYSPILRSPRHGSSPGLDPKRIFAAVTSFYGLDDAALSRRHDPHLARAVAAWLCRRHTEASLRELAASLGLSRPDSVPNLTRRIETRLKTSPELSNDLAEILKRASSPDAGLNKGNGKRTKSPRKLTQSKTKNQG